MTWRPSVRPKMESSSPSMKASTTISCPASPKADSRSMLRAASSASSTVWQTMAPFPAASPEAFTTTGAPCSRIQASASGRRVKQRWAAVGTSARAMRSLAKALEDSMRAAAAEGPKRGRPRFRNTSPMPFARGISGPTMVRVIPFPSAQEASPATSSTERSTPAAREAMPGFGRVAKKLRVGNVPSELPEKGVLPPAVAHHEDLHGRRLPGGGRAVKAIPVDRGEGSGPRSPTPGRDRGP
jgi:hypothetical protein